MFDIIFGLLVTSLNIRHAPLSKKNFAFLVEEKDLNEKLFYLIRDVYNNNSILDKIRKNQRQFSDKNVYNNIDRVLKEIINGKN